MGHQHLRYETTDTGVATVWMDRPPANALHRGMMTELLEVAQQVSMDDDVRVVVLRSAVERFFVAGADLSMIDGGWDGLRQTTTFFHDVGNAWEAIPQPTVAAIDGVAAGGGCEMALTCDIRVMTTAPSSRIGLPESKVGLLPAGGGTQRLPRLVGRSVAMTLLLRGTLIDAEEAYRIGLVNELCAPEGLDAHLEELTAELAALPPLTLREIKRCGQIAGEVPLDVGQAYERDAILRLAQTQDAREGVAAFVEKRAPTYVGR